MEMGPQGAAAETKGSREHKTESMSREERAGREIHNRDERDENRDEISDIREQRAKMREQRAESREQRTENREQRIENRE
jgi:hypothetical protein